MQAFCAGGRVVHELTLATKKLCHSESVHVYEHGLMHDYCVGIVSTA